MHRADYLHCFLYNCYMKKIYTLLFVCLLGMAGALKAVAGWPIGKKRFMVGTSFYTYFSKDYWDRRGNFHKNTNGQFNSYSASVFLDYGISRRLDVIANLPASYQVVKQSTGTINNVGTSDIQVGLSYVLYNYHLKNYITAYAGAIIPTYPEKAHQTLGYAFSGSELKLSNTGNITVGTHAAYYNVDADYRRYLSDVGPNQFNYMGTFGYFLNKYNQVLVDVAGTLSFSRNKAESIANYAGSTFDYRNMRVQLDYGYTVNRRISVYASGFYTVSGFNIGQAYGTSLQLLLRL